MQTKLQFNNIYLIETQINQKLALYAFLLRDKLFYRKKMAIFINNNII